MGAWLFKLTNNTSVPWCKWLVPELHRLTTHWRNTALQHCCWEDGDPLLWYTWHTPVTASPRLLTQPPAASHPEWAAQLHWAPASPLQAQPLPGSLQAGQAQICWPPLMLVRHVSLQGGGGGGAQALAPPLSALGPCTGVCRYTGADVCVGCRGSWGRWPG
jgi:hypothetical protein